MTTPSQKVLLDGSRLIIESLVRAGADTFVGYPITPANLLYHYSIRKFPLSLPAPDEITVMQWMAGLSAAGKLPVTATSFPGLALMVESINMAFMMELPLVIVLAQRLGPSTGTATAGAQGDIMFLRGLISGAYSLPTFCISNLEDCWTLPPLAVKTALELRTPVVILTSKEMIMTQQSFDLASLPEIKRVERKYYSGKERYKPYLPTKNLVPPFLPVGNDNFQVRFTASTHNEEGIIAHSDKAAMDNTRRLQQKMEGNLAKFQQYEFRGNGKGKVLLFSLGISANAVREAREILGDKGMEVDYLIAKTLFPVPDKYYEIIESYEKVYLVEENLTGQYAQILFGWKGTDKVKRIGKIGKMIAPQEIVEEVERSGK